MTAATATATAAAGDRDPLRSTRPTIVGPSSGPPPPPFPLYLSGPVVRGFGRGSKELGIPTANLDRGNESLKRFLSEVAARTNEQAEEEGQGSSRVQDDSGSARGTGIYFGFARILMPDVVAARKGDDDPSSSSIVPSRETISALPRQTAAYPSAAAAAASTTSTGDQSQLPDHEDDAGAEAAPTHRQSHDGDDDDSKVWPMVMSVGWNPFYGNKELTAEVHIVHNYRSDFYGREMRVSILGYIRPELNYISKEALIADINTDAQVALASLAREGYAKMAEDAFFRE